MYQEQLTKICRADWCVDHAKANSPESSRRRRRRDREATKPQRSLKDRRESPQSADRARVPGPKPPWSVPAPDRHHRSMCGGPTRTAWRGLGRGSCRAGLTRRTGRRSASIAASAAPKPLSATASGGSRRAERSSEPMASRCGANTSSRRISTSNSRSRTGSSAMSLRSSATTARSVALTWAAKIAAWREIRRAIAQATPRPPRRCRQDRSLGTAFQEDRQ